MLLVTLHCGAEADNIRPSYSLAGVHACFTTPITLSFRSLVESRPSQLTKTRLVMAFDAFLL